MMGINKDFEKWWRENEKQFMADSCHMSEFHMAGLVWEAAILHEREICKAIADNCALHCDANDNPYGANAAKDISDRIADQSTSETLFDGAGIAAKYEIPENSGCITLKDWARMIIESGGCGRFWGEIAMNIDGHKVNMETVVSFVDNKPCGQMFKGFLAK